MANANTSLSCDIVVIGAGPGGYTAAFRAADLGKKVILVEKYPHLGGVCLNVGCIPSKALLHAAKVISDANAIGAHGIQFQPPKIDIDRLGSWKNATIQQLTRGLSALAKQRKVTVIQGTARFLSEHRLLVEHEDKSNEIEFAHAIIAVGSKATEFPAFPDDPRMMDSTDALALEEIPKSLLVIGGGIIGLEMATVYQGLGSEITVVELSSGLIPGADRDLIKPLQKHLQPLFKHIHCDTKVESIKTSKKGLTAKLSGKCNQEQTFDRVLLAVGRKPNGSAIDAEKAGVTVSKNGFIDVDREQRTNVRHIFAIGDVVGQPMLAHKATHQGKVAAEVAAGEKSGFDALVIPGVAYTDPEVAWAGITENQAREQGIPYAKSVFPWIASGRALSLDRGEGLTKLLFAKDSNRLIGAGIVGSNAGDLIAEAALAIEMGCDAEDIGLTIHPHPTLSETIALAAEMHLGTITDLYVPKKT